jgi:hypothetical protein
VNYYPYFLPSLASLQFPGKAPFSYERFLSLADGLLPREDRVLLEELPGVMAGTYTGTDPVIVKWQGFDTALRNELVKVRAARKHRDASEFLRGGEKLDLSVVQLAMHAWRAPNILEGEKILDRARWEFLDECVRGHFFDRDMLFAYGMQLLIALRWERIQAADTHALVEEALV